jgi:hypothetical protein
MRSSPSEYQHPVSHLNGLGTLVSLPLGYQKYADLGQSRWRLIDIQLRPSIGTASLTLVANTPVITAAEFESLAAALPPPAIAARSLPPAFAGASPDAFLRFHIRA